MCTEYDVNVFCAIDTLIDWLLAELTGQVYYN